MARQKQKWVSSVSIAGGGAGSFRLFCFLFMCTRAVVCHPCVRVCVCFFAAIREAVKTHGDALEVFYHAAVITACLPAVSQSAVFLQGTVVLCLGATLLPSLPFFALQFASCFTTKFIPPFPSVHFMIEWLRRWNVFFLFSSWACLRRFIQIDRSACVKRVKDLANVSVPLELSFSFYCLLLQFVPLQQ